MEGLLSEGTYKKYLELFSQLNTDSKKELILKLIESFHYSEKKDSNLSRLFGAWQDKRDADDIIADIMMARVDKKDPVQF